MVCPQVGLQDGGSVVELMCGRGNASSGMTALGAMDGSNVGAGEGMGVESEFPIPVLLATTRKERNSICGLARFHLNGSRAVTVDVSAGRCCPGPTPF